LPIGTPISNTQVYVLDEHLQPVPIGVVGELFTGGDGVARGYWKRPELTDAAFVSDMFSGIPGARLYRTGDMVRYRANGILEFLGRKDGQVKVRGHRVELGEIETVLAQYPGLRGVTVTVKENHRREKELIAFVIPTRSPAPSASTLRHFLNEKLPTYMIPTHFVETSTFPLSPNGKVDRAALLRWDSVSLSPVEEVEQPLDMTEVQMLALWQRVLNRDDINLRDDFFEVGGHSLLAAELCTEIERIFGQHLPLSALFNARTPKAMATALSQDGWKPQWESLVTIQSGGALPPLFLIPGVGGNVVGFAALARALGADQPVYGFQSCGFNGKEKPLTRIEDIARRFVNELEKTPIDGPFLLAGVCMGGLVAFEMAQQLLKHGKKVALLILIETWLPSAMTPYGALAWNTFAQFRFIGQKIAQNWEALCEVELGKQWEYIWKKLRTKVHSKTKVHYALERVALANNRAAVKYVPTFYSGKTCLILASGRAITLDGDPRLNWKQLTAPELDVRMSPGTDSGQMLISPNVDYLCFLIKELVRKVTL
jgi:thioesterase domain-containing protein